MHIGLSPLQSGNNFEATIQDCECAEALGFDSVWIGEHHNHPLLYPTPLIGLAAIASGRGGCVWGRSPPAAAVSPSRCG